MRPIALRIAALVAAPALTVTVLAATSTPASAGAPAATDPAPAAESASWLASQLTGGLVHNDQYDFDDYGLSIDVGLGLAAVGGHTATVGTISDAIATNIKAYTQPGSGTNVSAGGTAKALVLAEAAGADATSYGGVDLVGQLEDTVATDGAIAGRIQDDWTPVDQYSQDYANVIGQAYAVQGLDAAGSASTAAATGFLLEQQCAAGWFRLSFSDASAASQTCDADATATPDNDVTAEAVLALASQSDDAGVKAHLDSAEAWLLAAQEKNGSFGGGGPTKAPNANSTGLAGWALATLGDTDAASRAAGWIRAHQATNAGYCVYYDHADLGAIAYDGAAVKTLQAGPIDATAQDQFRRATAQALPVLKYAPAGTGDPNALFTAEYVKAGGFKPVGVTGAAPGEVLCAMEGEQSVLRYANADGEAQLPVLIPKKTAVTKVHVANAAGRFGTVAINALGAKKIHFTLKSKVPFGEIQTVKATGLAPGEMVTFRIRWPAKGGHHTTDVLSEQANGKGVYATYFKAPKAFGTAKATVTGAFGNRKASKTFTVTR